MDKFMQLSNMDAYYEQVVKKKFTSSTVSGLILAMVLIVGILIASIWLSVTIWSWMFPIALIMFGLGVYLIYYILKNSRVEYEYTFVIGELRIARIKGRSKRKTITYFDVKSIDDIDLFIDPETRKPNVDLRRFRIILHAAIDDHRDDTYYMIIHDKVRRQPAVLLFTPNERTLEMIQPYFSVELKKKFLKRKKEMQKQHPVKEAAAETPAESSVPEKQEAASFADREKKAEQTRTDERTAEQKAEKKSEAKKEKQAEQKSEAQKQKQAEQKSEAQKQKQAEQKSDAQKQKQSQNRSSGQKQGSQNRNGQKKSGSSGKQGQNGNSQNSSGSQRRNGKNQGKKKNGSSGQKTPS